ncbi:MAG: ABC transporter ATP-binding protein [Chloroflexi bacterium]|nr:ABC transporter ATP-binding protein [Chloroflexota bacterium]
MFGPGRYRKTRAQQLASPRGQLAQLRYVPRALRLVWAAAPGWTAASLALVVAQGVLPIFTVYLTRAVVNALVAIVGSGGAVANLRPAAATIGLMGLVLLAGELLDNAASYVRTALAEQVQDHMNGLIHAQAVALDLSFYESPTYYDQLQRASIDAIDRPLGLLESLSSLLQSAITLAAMAGVLLTFAWWLPLALLIGTLPALRVALRTTWQFHQWRLINTTHQRRLTYYHRALTSDTMAAEIRLFDLGGHFSRAYHRLRGRLRDERLSLSRQQMAAQAGASLIGLLTLALALGWMAWRALAGRFNLGDLAMFYQAMSQGQRLMRSLLTGVGEIYRNLLFLEDLFAFLDLRPQLADPAQPAAAPAGLRDGIRLAGVTFRYPDSARPALADFTLEIPAGQIVAIVGENGAGKSTLLKLLCRFYDPQGGAITWDGCDLRALAQADLRRRITVLFQQPAPYHDTAADNIAFGDLASQPSRAQIEQAAAAAAADTIIRRLPDGYETVLGRWFGYTELSVGEWQRLALARAFIRQADLVILDEPTSAMDSWAEAAWMGRFRELVAGRTALIITHRFTTAMQADIIHVMHEGRVVESGTHAELVAQGGRYAASWRLQMREAQAGVGMV